MVIDLKQKDLLHNLAQQFTATDYFILTEQLMMGFIEHLEWMEHSTMKMVQLLLIKVMQDQRTGEQELSKCIM